MIIGVYFSNENIRRTNEFLNKIKPLADDKNATIAQIVIRWTLDQPGITIALTGARNPKQARENAEAADETCNGLRHTRSGHWIYPT